MIMLAQFNYDNLLIIYWYTGQERPGAAIQESW